MTFFQKNVRKIDNRYKICYTYFIRVAHARVYLVGERRTENAAEDAI